MKPLRVVVTGGRPDDLYDFDRDSYLPFRESLTNLFDELTLGKSRSVIVITGGEQGAEQIAFWAAERAKRDGFPIENIVICSTMLPLHWSETGAFGRMEYEQMLRCATKVIVSEPSLCLSTMLNECDVVFLFHRSNRPNREETWTEPIINQAKHHGLLPFLFDVDEFGKGFGGAK